LALNRQPPVAGEQGGTRNCVNSIKVREENNAVNCEAVHVGFQRRVVTKKKDNTKNSIMQIRCSLAALTALGPRTNLPARGANRMRFVTSIACSVLAALPLATRADTGAIDAQALGVTESVLN